MGKILIPTAKKLYLAHPFNMRHEVREWELGFEERTGINLDNPFYDAKDRNEILAKIDKGIIEPRTVTRMEDAELIMVRDLKKIEQDDGLLAFIEKGEESFGTPMELFYGSRILRKPCYVVTKSMKGHPWIKALAEKIFKDGESFEKYFVENNVNPWYHPKNEH